MALSTSFKIGLAVWGTSMVWVLIGLFIWLISRRWNIPVTVLRFTGDKRRPTLIHKKARKASIKGVTKLWVKGYHHPIRDFQAEYYYPSPKTAWGGLVLWEFEDGWLTPSIPKSIKLSKEVRAEVDRALDRLRAHKVVNFEYDEALHQELKLKIIDDVDADFAVNEYMRQESQYKGGFLDWLKDNAATVMAVMVVMFVLVGFVIWMKEAPNMWGNCAAAAMDTIKDSILEQAADKAVPPG